jgi:AcrR family transcriptional regulator
MAHFSSQKVAPRPQRRPDVGDYPHGRVPADVRSAQLLDVAERLFATMGYAATSIEMIAREAGVTRPVVYKRFGSKEAIYLACLRRARAQMESMLVQAVTSATGLEAQVERAADAYFRFVERDPQRWRVLFGGDAAVSGGVVEEAMQMHLATEERFADLFAIAPGQHDPQQLIAFSHAVGGAAHQLAQWWLRTPGVSREQVVEWFCAVVWTGLGALLGGV